MNKKFVKSRKWLQEIYTEKNNIFMSKHEKNIIQKKNNKRKKLIRKIKTSRGS